MIRRAQLSAVLMLLLQAPAAAQDAAAEDPGPLVAQAIGEWVDGYERARLGPRGQLRGGSNLQPAYVATARKAGFVTKNDEDRVTHLDMLQKLLFFAESHPSAALGDAVLRLAAVGLEGAFLDQDSLQLREAGHWSLMRMDHQGAWFVVLRAAAGERVPVLADARADEDQGVEGIARRVAALRLLGAKALPVFRSTIEAALGDADPRVRLSAAEAMATQGRADSLRKVAAALSVERHPVVAQALVRLLLTVMRACGAELEPERRAEVLATALERFGRCGWRTDMDLLDLVEAFPHKEAIPAILNLLELSRLKEDKLTQAVNKRASPILRERAGGLLRAMTGALIPADDVAAWRAFWEAEKDKIVVPERLAQEQPGGTRAKFFGLPVTGGSIVFVVDTSGSMNEAPAGTEVEPPRGRRPDTRLRAAKEQLVAAVQAMPEESRYTLVTFAAEARTWNSEPMKPGPQNVRSLTEVLSRLGARGSTNLFDGLSVALHLGDARFGEEVAAKVDEIFVLSDGEPTAGEVQDVDTLLRIVREANKYARVRIHAVFTGTGKGGDLLRRLAEENGGVFVQR